MAGVIADATDANCGQLPQVSVVDLSHSDIEFVGHPGGDRFQYSPLTLQRRVPGETEIDLADSNIHDMLSRLKERASHIT